MMSGGDAAYVPGIWMYVYLGSKHTIFSQLQGETTVVFLPTSEKQNWKKVCGFQTLLYYSGRERYCCMLTFNILSMCVYMCVCLFLCAICGANYSPHTPVTWTLNTLISVPFHISQCFCYSVYLQRCSGQRYLWPVNCWLDAITWLII